MEYIEAKKLKIGDAVSLKRDPDVKKYREQYPNGVSINRLITAIRDESNVIWFTVDDKYELSHKEINRPCIATGCPNWNPAKDPVIICTWFDRPIKYLKDAIVADSSFVSKSSAFGR